MYTPTTNSHHLRLKDGDCKKSPFFVWQWPKKMYLCADNDNNLNKQYNEKTFCNGDNRTYGDICRM